jgi:hypothetical protein
LTPTLALPHKSTEELRNPKITTLQPHRTHEKDYISKLTNYPSCSLCPSPHLLFSRGDDQQVFPQSLFVGEERFQDADGKGISAEEEE